MAEIKRHVYVVMSNDFPDCVFADEAAAEQYVASKEAEEKTGRDRYTPRIHWRVYDFGVK